MSQKIVTVSVGTDHHRFDRLVTWMDEWANQNTDIRIVLQRGPVRAHSMVEQYEAIPHGELCDLFIKSHVVVCHGGPGTVMDARRSGRFPLVVPRDPELSEHVDGHQLEFADHLERHRLAKVIRSKDELFAAIDAGLDSWSVYEAEVVKTTLGSVVAFGAEVDRLIKTKTIVSSPEETSPAGSSNPDVIDSAMAEEASGNGQPDDDLDRPVTKDEGTSELIYGRRSEDVVRLDGDIRAEDLQEVEDVARAEDA